MSRITPDGLQTQWTLDANGFQLLLVVEGVDDATGKVSGTLQDGPDGQMWRFPTPPGPGLGAWALWNEAAGVLTFHRDLADGETQTYTGFLFDTSGDPQHALAIAGTFTSEPFEDPSRLGFGWYGVGDPQIAP